MRELQQAIQDWQQLGDLLIIGGDWNADTNDPTWKRFWWEIGLYAPIKKGNQEVEATYNRGSLQVDNIYVSPTLRHLEYTMVPINKGVSGADHKALLLQVPKTEMGIGPMPIQKYQGRHLKLQDPHTREKYLKTYKHQCVVAQVFKQSRCLRQQLQPTTPLTEEQQREFEEIDQIRVKAMQQAERTSRKLWMGNVEWSPAIAASRNKIALWTAMIKARQGRKVSSRLIQRLMVKAGQEGLTGITLTMAQQWLKDEMKMYLQLKKQASQLRDTHIESLAAAQAEDSNGNKAKTLSMLRAREKQHQLFRRIRLIQQPHRQTGGLMYVIDSVGN